MSTNRYIDKLKARLAKEADQRMQLQALLDDQVARNRALLAERDALLRQADTLTEWYSNSLDVISDITAALPGTQYMDPPDGGDVSVPEQVRRMAKDAERYRWMRAVVIAEREGCTEELYDNECDRLLEAYDAALQGAQP